MSSGGFDPVAFRRELHSHPETAFGEIRTSARIATELAALGVTPHLGADCIAVDDVADYPTAAELDAGAQYALRTGADARWVGRARDGGTGVVANIVGSAPGPTWAIRCDIDALAVTESADPGHFPAQMGFASSIPGRMHACGHDGHAAIGVGVAQELLGDRDFAGVVRLVFEPAEEGGRGAAAMLRGGVMEGVDRVLAVHLGLDRPTGDVIGGVLGGFATDKLRAHIDGVAAHASLAPHAGRNALVAAAQATMGILAQPRWPDAYTRLNVGRLVAGDAVNVIPSSAEMLIEVRSTDDQVQDGLRAAVERTVHGSAAAHGCQAHIVRTGGSVAIRSDGALAQAVAQATAEIGGNSVIHGDFNASDDASLLMRHVQAAGGLGAYAVVGASNPAPHHSGRFDIDEASIDFAIRMVTRLIRRPA